MCRVLLHYSGWFKHIEPPRTFSNKKEKMAPLTSGSTTSWSTSWRIPGRTSWRMGGSTSWSVEVDVICVCVCVCVCVCGVGHEFSTEPVPNLLQLKPQMDMPWRKTSPLRRVVRSMLLPQWTAGAVYCSFGCSV